MKRLNIFIPLLLCVLCSCQRNRQIAADVALYTADSLYAAGQMLQPDTLLDAAINYYQNCWNTPEEKLARAYFYKGCIYDQLQQYNTATENYFLADQLSPKQGKLKADIYYNIGLVNLREREYELAQEYFSKAGNLYRQNTDTFRYVNTIISLSEIKRAEKKFAEAEMLYRQALELTSNSQQLGYIYQGMAYSLYDKQEYDSTIFYIQQSLQCQCDSDFYALSHNILGRAFYKKEQYDSAEIHALTALSYSSDPYIDRGCYWILDHVNQIRKKSDTSLMYAQKRVESYKAIAQQSVEIKTTPKTVIQKQQLSVHNRKLSKITIVVSIIAAAVLILLLIIIFLFNRYHKHDETQRQHIVDTLHAEKEKLQDVSTHLLYLQQHKAREYLKSIREDSDSRSKIKWKDWAACSTILNENLNGIIEKLQTQYNLSESYQRVCVCILLNLSNAEMAEWLNHARNSIGQDKNRTAKKLNTTASNLYTMLLTIIGENKEPTA